MKVLFGVDKFDKDGDVYERGIYLIFEDFASIKIGKSMDDFEALISNLQSMREELSEELCRRRPARYEVES